MTHNQYLETNRSSQQINTIEHAYLAQKNSQPQKEQIATTQQLKVQIK